ncbi:Competence F-like protein [Hyphomicrobium sulfonivorans]|uniref:Competence F-like protein n=1 Tax=Hyphomicrobium sulfonivorans TaxID=121290 RepID=A0A120CUF9_HYPSL|nr:Competence F-like protein [Hyphomicrobium sulfonivorans]
MSAAWNSTTAPMRRAARAVSDFLVPPLCLACHAPIAQHGALCAQCWSRVDFIRQPVCDRLGTPLAIDIGAPAISAAAAADPPEYDRARAVARFDGVMRELVHGLKFRDQHGGRQFFGRVMASAGAELLSDADALIPVPLTRWRLLGRRFNQSAVLAQEIARNTGLRYLPAALLRSRKTQPQVGLTRVQRRDNVAGAFAVSASARGKLEGARIVLVDDVITTGATVRACARALKSAGAARVDVLALAIVTDEALLPP